MTDVLELFVLEARVAQARQAWLEIERLAEAQNDEQLNREVDLGRLGILLVADRVQQLLDQPVEPDPQLEAAS